MPWNFSGIDLAELEQILDEYNALINQTRTLQTNLGEPRFQVPTGRYVAMADERPTAGQVQYVPPVPEQTAEVKAVIELAKAYKEMMKENYEYRCKRPEKELLAKLFSALDKV